MEGNFLSNPGCMPPNPAIPASSVGPAGAPQSPGFPTGPGCWQWVELESIAIASGATIEVRISPAGGAMKPVTVVDLASGADVFIREPKVGGTPLTQEYVDVQGGTAVVIGEGRQWQVIDMTYEALRSGVRLFPSNSPLVNTTQPLTFTVANDAGIAADFSCYVAFAPPQ